MIVTLVYRSLIFLLIPLISWSLPRFRSLMVSSDKRAASSLKSLVVLQSAGRCLTRASPASYTPRTLVSKLARLCPTFRDVNDSKFSWSCVFCPFSGLLSDTRATCCLESSVVLYPAGLVRPLGTSMTARSLHDLFCRAVPLNEVEYVAALFGAVVNRVRSNKRASCSLQSYVV